MNISGIQSYSGFYDYNSIRTNAAGVQQLSGAPAVPAEKEKSGQEQQNPNIAAETSGKQDFTAADYAKQYQPDATYEMKGADSDIQNLDMTQAISDMQKDQVLQQYQFFIGESQAQGNADNAEADSSLQLRGIENFSL